MARDRYIAEYKGHLGFKGRIFEGGDDTRSVQAFAEVERLLRVAVPAWTAPGFPPTSEINLSVYDDPYDGGFRVLNGLVYQTGGTSVIVTNRALLANHLRRSHSGSEVPVSMMEAAFRDGNFWSSALATDGAREIQYIVPVSVPAGADSATVALADFTQSVEFENPDRLLAAVVRGDRVWIAEERLNPPLAPFTACRTAYERGINVYPVAPTVQESARKHDEVVERAGRSYLACFARHLRQRPGYVGVLKQAQALVDLLH